MEDKSTKNNNNTDNGNTETGNNRNQEGDSAVTGQGQMDAPGTDNLRGVASRTGISGKTIIEQHLINSNVEGGIVTVGSGLADTETNTDNGPGIDASGDVEGTSGNLSGEAGGGAGISLADDDDIGIGTGGAGDNSGIQEDYQ
jgi:hypothetical protein